MFGKLLGKSIGTILAAPAIIARETEKAVEEASKTIDKAYDKLDNKK